MENYFTELNSINVNDRVETKNNLKYLSWAWAWTELKKRHPDATYVIYENTLPNGYVVNYFTDGKTCWVKTGVTVNGIEHIEELPVMNYRNQSIAVDVVTSVDINKTIQRSLTKAVARHGIGLYIYGNEDLPEDVTTTKAVKATKETTTATQETTTDKNTSGNEPTLKTLITEIGKMVTAMRSKDGNTDAYKNIVKNVTGADQFKCNAATQDDYDTVLKIYNGLIVGNYNA